VKLCDLTQFYSPVSGGVKRYLAEKLRFLQETSRDDEHVLIIPGERDEVIKGDRSRVYTLRSPLISRTSRYRALLRLEAVEAILERERPDLIESGDPYQIAWKAVHSGDALRIPVVGFYHSHFPEAYLRSAEKFLGRTATEFLLDFSRRYIRSLYNRFERTLVPSPALGEVPDIIDDPAIVMLWGITREMLDNWLHQGEADPNVLKGFAASSGVVEGTARVVRSVQEISKLKQGDILVCQVTNPTWAPVFQKIAAAVSDIGGSMSHAAIVAREYGLPAVVGTGRATERIPDGARIRVDGGRGVVTILQ